MTIAAARAAKGFLWPLRTAALGLGVLAATGQAPLDLWWVALPAFAGIALLVARARSGREAAFLGFAAGLGHFAVSLSWIVEPFLIDAARHGWMAPFALVLMAAGMALFWAAAAAAAHLGRPVALMFAVTLTLAELARGHVLTGFPWALPGHIWIAVPPGQTAALWGGYGLTLFTLMLAALPVSGRWRGAGLAVALLVTAWGYGVARLAAPEPAPQGAVVRLVQPNIDQAAKWNREIARDNLDRLLRLTAAPADPAPDLVIWPETSLPYFLDRAPRALAEIASAGGGAPVVVGAQRTDGGSRGWNTLASVGPDGAVTAIYDKVHLVPFGEYVPFGDTLFRLFGISAFAAQEGFGYSAGLAHGLVDLGNGTGRALPLICYEAVFPAIPRRAQAGARADWMVQITNDAWFGSLTGPYQHLALARLRAIEQGLPLLRAANTGVSAVIDARGRIVAALPLNAQGVLDTPLPGALPAPPYARGGEAPLVLLLAFGALAFAGLGWRTRT